MHAQDNLPVSHTFAICAYGQSPYLRECIESIVSQEPRQSEVYIATSTPCEWIENLAHEFDIPVYVNTGERGIGQDWNFAYSQARGDYVTIAHQDDVYCSNYAATAVDMLSKAAHPLIFFCNYGEIRDGKRVENNRLLSTKRFLLRKLKNPRNSSNIRIRRRALSLGSAICCPSVCISRLACPDPPFEIGMKSNLDWATWEGISKRAGDFCYAPQILMYHRIHADSATSHLIADNTRSIEDYEMLSRFWPRPVARILNVFYSRGISSNDL